MKVPTLSIKDVRRLQDLWLDDFHSTNTPDSAYGMTERWWNVFTTFLTQEGYELYPPELRTQEDTVIASGKSQEYLAALADVVIANIGPSVNEYDQTVLVLTASPDERAEALRKVLHNEKS